MKAQRAREIVKTLIAGVHPVTGMPLPCDSPLQSADVLRALLVADEALHAFVAREYRRAALPPKVGHPWSEDEVRRLMEGVRDNLSLDQIARRHGRTKRAIQSRLQLMDPESLGGTKPRSRGGAAAAVPHLTPETIT
jgi:hypothetical protein